MRWIGQRDDSDAGLYSFIDACLLVHAGGPGCEQGFPNAWVVWESLQFMQSKYSWPWHGKHYRHLVGSVGRKWKAQRPAPEIL